MNSRIRRSLISYARKLSLSWEPRRQAKDEAKIDAALHECSSCGNYCYEGKSDKNYEAYLEKYPDKTILYDSIKLDHIIPVVDPLIGDQGWDTFYKNLFCEKINFRPLCDFCHSRKTSQENRVRNTYYRPTKRKK